MTSESVPRSASTEAARAQIHEIVRQQLISSALFRAFDRKEIDNLLAFSELSFFQQGERIIQQGDPEDHRVYFLLMGSVSVYVDEKYILTLRRPWDIFGEMSICSAAPRSASVVADELVQVIAINASVIHKPENEFNYQFKYYFYNMFSEIMSYKLHTTSERAKLYEDTLLKYQEKQEYSEGLEQRVQDHLQQIVLYSHMINSTQDGICIMNFKGVVTMANPAMRRLLDVDEAHLIGRPFEEFLQKSEESPLPFSSILKQTKKRGWSGEAMLLRHRTDPFPVALSLSIVTNHQREKIAVSCIVRDISKQKAYEQQILQQKKELQEAYENLSVLDQLKDDFLVLMSHELRTPLTSILASAETLISLELVSGEDGEAFVQPIHLEAKRLEKLITKVLDLSKLENGNMFFSIRLNNLQEVVEQVANQYREKAEEKGLAFRCEFPEAPPLFNFDYDKIVTVVEELVENAIKFTETGEVLIRILPESEYTRVEVIDTGMGIAEKDHEKVFNKFELIEDMAYHHRGLGLGMPLSRLLVEAHEGTIWVESELEKGSMFYFTLSNSLAGEPEGNDDEGDEEDFSFLL